MDINQEVKSQNKLLDGMVRLRNSFMEELLLNTFSIPGYSSLTTSASLNYMPGNNIRNCRRFIQKYNRKVGLHVDFVKLIPYVLPRRFRCLCISRPVLSHEEKMSGS